MLCRWMRSGFIFLISLMKVFVAFFEARPCRSNRRVCNPCHIISTSLPMRIRFDSLFGFPRPYAIQDSQPSAIAIRPMLSTIFPVEPPAATVFIWRSLFINAFWSSQPFYELMKVHCQR